MATFTYTKPTVGGSEDTWGTTLNANWDALGTFLGSLDSAELAVLDGITSSTAELNLLDGVTVTLADITSTAAELNLLDGATATTAELNYLSGVTGAIQTQIDNIPQPPDLTQVQVEDDTSTVFGQVSGERLAQAIATSRENGGTPVATTSGTAFDFTSIPAEVQEVVVAFDGVSFSGTDHLLVQLGTSGGFVTTGYSSSSAALFGSGSLGLGSTAGFVLRLGTAAFAVYGQMTIRRLAPSSNVWVQSHGGHVDTSAAVTGGGGITLVGELTQVRITGTSTNTFAAGQLNVRWK